MQNKPFRFAIPDSTQLPLQTDAMCNEEKDFKCLNHCFLIRSQMMLSELLNEILSSEHLKHHSSLLILRFVLKERWKVLKQLTKYLQFVAWWVMMK